MADMSAVAQARAALLEDRATRSQAVEVTCADGAVRLSGQVDTAQAWAAVGDLVARLPGVRRVQNDVTVVGLGPGGPGTPDDLSHGAYRHGDERSWGGYGDAWYDREWRAIQQYRAAHGQGAVREPQA
jgi:hypothetical protein